MAVPVFNLTGDRIILQGSDYAQALQVKDSAGTPVDLTGYACRAQLRQNYADLAAAIVATFTCTVVDAPAGIVLLELSNATTAAMGAVAGGRWDLEAYDGTRVQRLVQGEWALSLEVTR